MRQIRKSKGFTLVETIIYVALIGMVVSTFVSFGLKVSEIRNKNYVVNEVQSNARLVLEFVADSLRKSSNVVVPNPTLTSKTLELVIPVLSDNMVFNLNSGVLYAQIGTDPYEQINSLETNITNLIFENVSEPGGDDSVKIFLDIEYRGNDSVDFMYSRSFETTVSLRL